MARASENRWVVLVRGINLGRNRRLAMADFRALLEALGYTNVRTHLASGNALVTTGGSKASAAKLEREIADRLKADLSLEVKVLVRSAEELAAVVEQNPFANEGIDPKQLQAAFLASNPEAVKTDSLDADQFAPDRFEFGDRVIYLHMPNGFMGSNLPDWEKLLGVAATIRTWNVVTKLRELAST